MSSSLSMAAKDASGRWYLVPGSSNSFDVNVANESDHAVLCKVSLDEPADAGTVSPSSLTLKAGESRTVQLAFKPEWLTLRDRKIVVTARDAAGTVLSTFVHDLVAALTTDCSVSLAWKEEISGDGGLRGFVLSCIIRSISATPGVFEPDFTPHPSLRFPDKQRITLGPGETSSIDVPIVWNRSARDVEGWNHPRSIEVGVAVTHGRRTATAPWDLVQYHVEPYLTDADRSPVIARRPPPPQFTPVAPEVSALGSVAASVAPPMPTAEPPSGHTHSERIANAELESGVTAGGLRLPPPPTAVTTAHDPTEPQTIAVAPSTLLLIALAVGAIAIALVWMLRVPVTTTAISTAPVVVASHQPPAFVRSAPRSKQVKMGHKRPSPAVAAATADSAAQSTAATSAAASTVRPATSSPSRPASSAGRTPERIALPPRVSPVDRSALVQLNDISAEYLRGGRVVHVFWDSYAQARAQVQVLDERDTLLAQTTVGRGEAAMLTLPRGYRAGVNVQVTAIGYDGTRVVSTTALGPP